MREPVHQLQPDRATAREAAMDLLEHAKHLAELGLSVHWLVPRAKVPIRRGWQARPYAPAAEVEREYTPGSNLGVVCGMVPGAARNVVVVDADGPAAVAWARQALPATSVRALTRHGEHFYYRHPGDGRVRSHVRAHGVPDGVVVDIRADGGQVVAPPSVHPSGFMYRQVEPWTAEALSSMPLYDRSWFPATVSRIEKSPPCPLAPLDIRCHRGMAYLARLAPAISGQGGHLATWRAALALVRGFALPADIALDLLVQEYNPLSAALVDPRVAPQDRIGRGCCRPAGLPGAAWSRTRPMIHRAYVTGSR
jgi:hypothetical protein